MDQPGLSSDNASMVKSKDCRIDVEFALALKNLHPSLAENFRCVECGGPVEPHKAGTGPDNVYHPAHFEHVKRNRACSLSDIYKSDSVLT